MNKTTIDHTRFFYPPGGILLWILIFLELITFGMALIALVYLSRENPEAYHQSRLLLNPVFGTINTLFLLTSGFFMAKSLRFFKENDLPKTKFYLKLTLLGGLFFLLLKTIEYALKIEHGLTISYDTFFSFYWLLTGFHIIHVLVGLVILISLLFGIRRKKDPTQVDDFEASAAFWHMCDLIWLLLFPLLYLIL